MLFEEQMLYGAVAVAAALATVGFGVVARQAEGRTRYHMLIAPAATGVLALGYVAMATETLLLFGPEGSPVYVTRFLVYGIVYGFTASYLGAIAGADRRYVLSALVGMWAYVFGAMGRHLAAPPVDSLTRLFVLGGFAYSVWLLVRPFTAAAAATSDDRRLLFGKLRNLQLLSLLMYLVVALTTRQALGLLDAFGGVYVSAYLDLFAHLAIGGIILRSETGIGVFAREYPSPVAVLFGGDTGDRPPGQPADD